VLQALGERRDARQAGVAGGGGPLREVLAGEVGDHGGEGADLAGCRVQFGAAVHDGFELGALVPGQVVRAAAERARDVPDGWRGLAGVRRPAFFRLISRAAPMQVDSSSARPSSPACRQPCPAGRAAAAAATAAVFVITAPGQSKDEHAVN
jgi:hypothetical protein